MTHSQRSNKGYKHAKSTMRILGPVLLALGGVLTIIGVGSFLLGFFAIVSGSSSSGTSTLFFLALPGMALLGIGGMITQAGYLKEVAQYTALETSPAVTTTVSAIKSALTEDDILCSSCSAPIEPDSKFCSSCGIEITKLQCAKCHAEIEPDDKYCGSCGTTIT